MLFEFKDNSKVLDKTCIEYVTVICYLGEDLKGG